MHTQKKKAPYPYCFVLGQTFQLLLLQERLGHVVHRWRDYRQYRPYCGVRPATHQHLSLTWNHDHDAVTLDIYTMPTYSGKEEEDKK